MNALLLTEQLKSLYEETHLGAVQPDEFTRAMFMEITHCSRTEAETIIRNWLAAGRIVYVGERLSTEKRRAKAYRLVVVE